MHPPILSVVDYNAWDKGYMPPSEHVLIDALSYRGARVVASSTSPDSGWWLVVKGDVPVKGMAKLIHHHIAMLEDIEREQRQAVLASVQQFARAVATPIPDGVG